jgi:5-methylcytosine-specific restriction protein A
MPTLKRNSDIKSPAAQFAEPFSRHKSKNRWVYDSHRWKLIREKVLSIEPLCVMCRQDSRVTAATVVDHITPMNEGGDPFDMNNLQGLCASCHNKKSSHESRK